MDLGFELQGNFNVVFVNEFHKAFNDVCQYARQQMGIAQPVYGHHVEDITEYTDGEHEEKLANLIELVNESKHTDYRLSVYVRIVSAGSSVLYRRSGRIRPSEATPYRSSLR